jgi:bifunctional non-homologous end joining protein LigD
VATKKEVLSVAGREVTITNPEKIYFPKAGHTKLDVVRYYLTVAEGALRGVAGRPMALKRYVNGAEGEFFFQKRAPESRPAWIETVELRFPSGRTADEIYIGDAAQLAWIANLGCLDLNPHPVRADDLDHPDELRIDLDPVPGVEWPQIREVAMVARQVLIDHKLVGWPKTSGSRGIHVYVRVERRWGFSDVRKAALAIAREVERRAPEIATSKWWKEERHGVFLDYNQNAKDRTVASAYSVRPTPDARVSAPVTWAELADADPAAFTLATMPARWAKVGDPSKGIDEAVGDLTSLLELADRFERDEGDAPWPPHYAKQPGEPPRVQPSKRKGTAAAAATAKPKRSTRALLIVARSTSKDAALAGLERWKTRHPDIVERLAKKDFLVDSMRGRYTTWTRVRVNLTAIPEAERPPQETPDPDYEPPEHG